MSTSAVLDLTRRAFEHHRGPIAMIGTWIRMAEAWEPCIALVRAGEELSSDTFPCIIPLSRAWVWNEAVGDPREAAQTTHRFLQALRLTSNPQTAMRLVMFIDDFLGDLLTMPASPPDDVPLEALAEVTITNRSTGKTTEVVLTDV